MSILIIAEKPSVARGICPVVKADSKKKGYIEGNGYIVSWCLGHLVGLKYPNDYGNGWESKWSFSQLPMIPREWLFKVTDSTKEQFHILKDLMNRGDVTEIICATDADREGETIFRYVYNMVGCHKPVKRLWVFSLEESAIRKALATMKPMSAYDNLYSAGCSRARADWLVGMNGSRLFSCRYNDRLNLGRVQTPTLAMIVQRDYNVQNFVKQKYFTVDLNYNGCIFSSSRIDDENTADNLVSTCKNSTAVISSVKNEAKTVNPHKLYDLTTLQRDANKTFGYTAQQTLDCVQSLYEAKIVTYPRTDSQYLSDDMEQTALDVIRLMDKVFLFGSVANPDISRCINNSKVTGHHAIIPTVNIGTADLSSLPITECNILRLIANRLLCASAPAHKYESVIITAICNNTEFTVGGKTVTQIGWKQFAPKNSDEKDDTKTLPLFTEGQQFSVTASKGEHFTSPPKPFTEDTLLSAMEHAGQENYDENSEKKGLGTPATRAGTIEGLVKKGYAERKNKQIVATEKGRNLINVVPDEVKSPKLTADWEMKLQQIENGEYPADSFMAEIENFICTLCNKYGFADSSVLFGNNAPIGKCPKCQSDVVKGKYGYYCKGKCGMVTAKVYGHELTENQIIGLLSGKSTSYTANGKKNIVLPEVVENTYNGKTNYQWKTERGK